MRKIAGFLLLLATIGCRQSVWKQEPTSFLGVKLGKPLSASVPLCDVSAKPETAHKLCADRYEDFAILDNEADMEGLISVHQVNGIVEQVDMVVGEQVADLTEQDLKQKYGLPTGTVGDVLMWTGKIVDINYSKPADGKPGFIAAYMPSAEPKQKPHTNPF
jgi:hypothetical protein